MDVPRKPVRTRSLPFCTMHFQTGDKREPFCEPGLQMAERSMPSDKICLDARAVRHCVGYGSLQLGRLEAAGKFPKRIQLGPCRVGWSFRDVLDWMQSKVDERPVGPMSPKVIIDTNDRFIAIKELRTLVLYGPTSVRTLELEGRFPGRVRLSHNRVVWLEREVREWVEAQRQRRAAEDTLKTYYVRLCRPRFEVTLVAVEATNPSTAQNKARTLAKEGKSGWRILPYDPQIYRPHVETCAIDEGPTYRRDSAEAILSKYQDKYVRYLMLYADTNGGHGEVLLQPWSEDNKEASISHNLANNWISAIRRHVSTPPKSTRRKRELRDR